MNQQGQLVDNPDNITYVEENKVEFISKKNNIDYYFEKETNSIIKTIWTDNTNYSSETIKLNLNYTYSSYAFTQNKIYFLNENHIFYINIETNQQQDVISEYYFNSISSDNLGNIYFEAINSSLDDIAGIINNNGDIQVFKTKNAFKVIYISPII